ncbi:MAG: 3-oxoacyl-ACP synthase III [Pirellulaceae bacterium]
MQYHNVCLESIGYVLPDEIVTSETIEAQLAPLYERLRLPEGRLELMTGIRERRFWAKGVMPSQMSIVSGRRALAAADFPAERVKALLHCSVCRDFLEPATASGVHCGLQLPSSCVIYDVSNACLGLLNGILQVANMIELGQIEAGLVVGTESGRQLVENTIRQLNNDQTLTRNSIKSAVASLTIGSGSAGILLTHRRISKTQNRLVAAAVRADTAHHELCQSGRDETAGSDMQPLMKTDSEELMRQGVETGVATFAEFSIETGWTHRDIDRTICHQVGSAHRKLMLESLGLNTANDFATFPWLGNTGAVALPLTLAAAASEGFISSDQSVSLLGIGSGINCLMLGVQWQESRILGGELDRETAGLLVQGA